MMIICHWLLMNDEDMMEDEGDARGDEGNGKIIAGMVASEKMRVEYGDDNEVDSEGSTDICAYTVKLT